MIILACKHAGLAARAARAVEMESVLHAAEPPPGRPYYHEFRGPYGTIAIRPLRDVAGRLREGGGDDPTSIVVPHAIPKILFSGIAR